MTLPELDLPVCEMIEGIAQHGAVIVTNIDSDNDFVVAHTIGLTESHGHPELFTLCHSEASACGLLASLAGRIHDGDRFDDADIVAVGADLVELSDLGDAPIRRGLFDVWFAFYSATDMPQLEVLLVGAVDDGFD